MDRHAEAVALASQVRFTNKIYRWSLPKTDQMITLFKKCTYLTLTRHILGSLQVLATSPHSVEALVARAKAHRAAGRLQEALHDLALAHDLMPANRLETLPGN